MQPYHFFDLYREDRDKAARERGEWGKAHRIKGGPHQDGPLWRKIQISVAEARQVFGKAKSDLFA
jgi:hypothetical protein